PDLITTAKALAGGMPLSAVTGRADIMDAVDPGGIGGTYAGNPVACAAALAAIDLIEREDLLGRVRANEPLLRDTLEQLRDIPLVGDVRGAGYFWGIELVKDKTTKETFDAAESERLLRGFLSKALFDAGLYCRADDRGDPVIQLAPPLIAGPQEFEEIGSILRGVLTEAWARL
ncbi:MAG TPA: aminotransferase class III-fold pyridoxal phosphate-dependent enzyme, partial [Nonomuraea sp.]|nr:aminotransferase class III-fold pyridoxal phosphate-dependent enzyme [Nonomuraea sp.]